MRRLRISRPSPAMVVACIAMAVSLGGTAIAAKKIGPKQIKKGGVKTKNLAKEAVKKNKLADGAVVTSKLDGQAVTQGKLADESVGTAKLRTNAVTQKNLARDSVGTAQLLAGAVGTNKLRDAAVTGPKVANGSLGPAKIAQATATVSAEFSGVDASDCPLSGDIAVPGMQLGDDVLVYPKDANASNGWDSRFTLDGYTLTGDDTIQVMVCNVTTQNDIAATLPLQVLLFR